MAGHSRQLSSRKATTMAGTKRTAVATPDEPDDFGRDLPGQAAAVDTVRATFGDVEFPVEITSDPDVIQKRILGKLFQAKTLDDAFGVWETTTSDQLANKRFRIVSVRWGSYQADDGPIPLAEVEAVNLDTGEADEWVTTAPNLTGFMAWAQSTDNLPFEARIVAVKTRRGYTSLHFERA